MEEEGDADQRGRAHRDAHDPALDAEAHGRGIFPRGGKVAAPGLERRLGPGVHRGSHRAPDDLGPRRLRLGDHRGGRAEGRGRDAFPGVALQDLLDLPQVGPIAPLAREHAPDEGVDLVREARHGVLQGRDAVDQHLLDDLPQVVGGDGPPAREALVEDHAQRPHVDAVIELAFARALLGRHVVRRPHHRPGARERGRLAERPLHARELREPEVEDLDDHAPPLVREEDVGRLEVAVDDAPRVHAADRGDDREQEARRLRERQAPLAHEPVVEGLADQEVHDHDGRAVLGLEDVVDADDVRVGDGARGAGLAGEATARVGAARLVDQLEGHGLVRDEVGRRPHAPHAAPAEEAVDAVAPCDDVERGGDPHGGAV